MSALFLSPPSFDGFDGGAGARYQARREVTSYWYPTWLAQPAALVPGSRLLDCPPHNVGMEETLRIAKGYDHVIINTSTPSLKNDCKVAEAKAAVNKEFSGAKSAYARNGNDLPASASAGGSCGTGPAGADQLEDLKAKIAAAKKIEVSQ